MAIPEGSCPGTGTVPSSDSIRPDTVGRRSGICPECGGRFRLATDGLLPNHAPAR